MTKAGFPAITLDPAGFQKGVRPTLILDALGSVEYIPTITVISVRGMDAASSKETLSGI